MRVDCMHKILMSSLGYLDCVRSAPFDLTEPGFPSIQTFFSSDKSPLNPHWFPLGSAIIYLLLIFKMLLSPFISLGVYDLYLIGRPLSIIADIGSMVFIYIIAKNIFGVSGWWGRKKKTLTCCPEEIEVLQRLPIFRQIFRFFLDFENFGNFRKLINTKNSSTCFSANSSKSVNSAR